MIIYNATKRHEIQRESDSVRSSTSVRHAPAVEFGLRQTKRNGQRPSASRPLLNVGSGNSARNQNISAGTNFNGFSAGWSLLAPLTAGFIVDTVARAAARRASSNKPEVMRQLDQYKNLQKQKQREQQQEFIDPPEILEPVIEDKTSDDQNSNKDRLDLNSLRILRGTGQKLALPMRPYVPGPVRAGRVFQEADATEEPHKMFKSGWVKLRSHRR